MGGVGLGSGRRLGLFAGRLEFRGAGRARAERPQLRGNASPSQESDQAREPEPAFFESTTARAGKQIKLRAKQRIPPDQIGIGTRVEQEVSPCRTASALRMGCQLSAPLAIPKLTPSPHHPRGVPPIVSNHRRQARVVINGL